MNPGYEKLCESIHALTKRIDAIETDVTGIQRVLVDIERVNESYDGFCLLQQQQQSPSSSGRRNATTTEDDDDDEETRNYRHQHWCCWFCI